MSERQETDLLHPLILASETLRGRADCRRGLGRTVTLPLSRSTDGYS
jgi:hypothetical protein